MRRQCDTRPHRRPCWLSAAYCLPQYLPSTKDALADRERVGHLLPTLGGELAGHRLVGRRGGALTAIGERREVLLLVRAGAARELGKQCLEAGAELKRRLSGSILIQVGPRPQEHGLADVDGLAA